MTILAFSLITLESGNYIIRIQFGRFEVYLV